MAKRMIMRIVIVSAALAAVFLSLTVGYIIHNSRQALVREIESRLELETEKDAQRIEVLAGETRSLASALAATPPIQGLIRAEKNDGVDEIENSTDEQWKTRLSLIFTGVMNASPHYSQIRLLDENGMETVRVNRKSGLFGDEVEVVAEEELQDKKDRAYFKEASLLSEGEIYVSAAELNRDGSPPKITEPPTPVVRYISPVFDEEDGSFEGMVVINLLVNDLVESVSLPITGLESYVVNAYWDFVLHPDQSKEWGGVNDFDTGINFFTEFPATAQADFSEDRGSFAKDGNIFVYSKARPDQDNLSRSWAVIERVPETIIYEQTNGVVLNAVILAIVVFVLLLFVFLIAVRTLIMRGLKEARLTGMIAEPKDEDEVKKEVKKE